MKLILISDFHLTSFNTTARKGNILEAGMNKCRFIIDYANKNNCHIVQAGDLTDKTRDWNVLDMIINEFSNLNENNLLFTIYGQHNLYYRTRHKDATLLGVLTKTLNFIIPGDTASFIGDGCVIYGASWDEEPPMFEPNDDFNILVIHESICEESLFPGHKYLNAIDYLEALPQYDIILCGDIHRKFIHTINNRTILNTGCLLRKDATEYNLTYKPGFFVLDYNGDKDYDIEWVEIPHEPGELILSRDHIESKKFLSKSVEEFARMTEDFQIKTSNPKQDLINYMESNNINENIKQIIIEEIEEWEVSKQ